MNQVSRIIKNTGVEVTSNIVNMILSALFTFIVARMFGPELYGTFSLVTTFPLIFASLTIFGLDCIIIRDIAREKGKSGAVLFNAILFQCILIVITSFITIISMYFLGYDIKIMFLIMLFFIFCSVNSVTTVNSSVFKAFEKMEYNALLNTGERFLVLITGITIIMKYGSVAPVLGVFLAVSIFKLVISLRISFTRFVRLEMRYEKSIFRYFFKEGYPVAVSSFFTAFRWNIVIVIISKMLTESDIGYYNAAFKITYPILLIIFAYSTAILPVISVYYGKDNDNLDRLYRVSCKLATVFSIPIAIIFTFFSSKIIMLLFGTQYLVSAEVLKIIIWILPSSFLLYPLGNLLVAMNHQKLAMRANGVNSVILLIAEVYLTAKYGLYGACAGIVAAEFLLVLVYFYNVTIKYKYIKISEFLLKPVAAGIVMFLILYLSREITIFISAPVGIAVYAGILYFTGIFNRDEIEKVRSSFAFKDNGNM